MLDRERFFRGVQSVFHGAFVAAATRGEEGIGTGHLLLGVLGADPGLFGPLRVDPAALRSQAEACMPPVQRTDQPAGKLPFTPEARRALEAAAAHVLEEEGDEMTPRDLLAGLAETREGVAYAVLAEADLDANSVRARLGLRRPSDETRERTARHRRAWERGSLPRVLSRARDLATEWKTHAIGTEHVLVALLSVAADELDPLLRRARVDGAALAEQVTAGVARGEREPDPGMLPMTDALRAVLETAFRESRGRRAEEIGAGVLLWALATSDEGATSRLLREDHALDPLDLWSML